MQSFSWALGSSSRWHSLLSVPLSIRPQGTFNIAIVVFQYISALCFSNPKLPKNKHIRETLRKLPENKHIRETLRKLPKKKHMRETLRKPIKSIRRKVSYIEFVSTDQSSRSVPPPAWSLLTLNISRDTCRPPALTRLPTPQLRSRVRGTEWCPVQYSVSPVINTKYFQTH